MKKAITPALAAGSWALTIILFAHMLDGTFDTRSCATACVQMLYWSAFAVAAGGWLYGILSVLRIRSTVTIISLSALTVLMGMFITIMFIGTFF